MVYCLQEKKQQTKNNEKYKTHLLVNSIKERNEYANKLKELIQQTPKGQRTWAFLKSKMGESAEQVAYKRGIKTSNKMNMMNK